MKEHVSPDKKLVIAIDGPAGAGKSTVAKAIAQALNYTYIDTGAMYRAVALAVLEAGIRPDDAEPSPSGADVCVSNWSRRRTETVCCLDGADVTETNSHAGSVRRASRWPPCRRAAAHSFEKQRAMARRGGIVMDGRDIGTVVLARR